MRLTPTYMFAKFTDLCNSRCVTCNIWQLPGTTLTVEDIERLDRFVDPVNLKEIYFTGGEPLLPDNAADIAIALHRWKPGVAITGATNALRPDLYLPKVAKIKAAGVWLNIMVSLNGLPATHDWSRGVPGNYDRAMEMAAGLKELGALCSFNLLEFPGVTTEADRLHVAAVAEYYGSWVSSSPILRHMPWFNEPDDGATIPLFECHAMEVICLHPDGEITACQEPRPDLRLGNLRDDCLDEAIVRRATEIIQRKECQPCGCCTGAYSLGIRCVT
jgi:MoaA/NifB/PqqE/SkfB family radical SAM enzyme